MHTQAHLCVLHCNWTLLKVSAHSALPGKEIIDARNTSDSGDLANVWFRKDRRRAFRVGWSAPCPQSLVPRLEITVSRCKHFERSLNSDEIRFDGARCQAFVQQSVNLVETPSWVPIVIEPLLGHKGGAGLQSSHGCDVVPLLRESPSERHTVPPSIRGTGSTPSGLRIGATAEGD